MQWLYRDLRYGIRESARRPGFTILALLTLGLGIGSATVMYSVIYNVLLNPFPYTDPRGMVDVVIQDTQQAKGGLPPGPVQQLKKVAVSGITIAFRGRAYQNGQESTAEGAHEAVIFRARE